MWAKLIFWIADKTGFKAALIKWAIILILAGLAGWGLYRVWSWIDGMQDKIAEQSATIEDQKTRITTLRGQRDNAIRVANWNADQVRKRDALRARSNELYTAERREAVRREGRLRSALDEIDKWPKEMDGPIGPGLRGTLDRLRRERGAAP